MLNKKIMVFGIMLVVSILLANVTFGNTSTVGLVTKEGKSCSVESKFEDAKYEKSEYIVIRGNDRVIYLKVPFSLDERSSRYLKELYLEQKEGEGVYEEPQESENMEVLIEVEEEEVTYQRRTINLTIPDFLEDIEIKEIVVFEDEGAEPEEEIEISPFIETETTDEIKRFSSYLEFMSYLGYDLSPSGDSVYCMCEPEEVDAYLMSYNINVESIKSTGTTSLGLPTVNSGSDYSTTNVQVAGVDEGDIIKNDNQYAYIISKDRKCVIIADVFPPEDARILSKVRIDGSITEVYLNDDQLIILGYEYYGESFVYIFDIGNKANPILMNHHSIKGSIQQSRMIGDYVYIISNQYISRYTKEEDLPVHPSQIYYFNNSDSSYSLTIITSINTKDESVRPVTRGVLIGYGNNIFVSVNNIYITYNKYEYHRTYNTANNRYYSTSTEKTLIHRISIETGMIKYQGMGDVPGRVLNRFSMDEYQDYFRIATTRGHVSRIGQNVASNQIYVLDMNLNVVGNIENIAPGERIYSARFMGNRAYMVTFKKVDPFFVIDLSNPRELKILGELKIPGYSNYLHPYDENHVIGIGKDTYDMGSFAWYQGVKLSLFDVSDVQNPKEKSKYIIGDRGTDSPALTDPHAFLFSKKNNLLVIPIKLAKIDKTKYPNAGPSTSGEYIWQGAFVFHISLEKGFVLKGKITHSDGSEFKSGYQYWYGYTDSTIKRSFYIEDVIYTYSQKMLKMNKMDDLREINRMVLPNDTESQGYSAGSIDMINIPQILLVNINVTP